MFLPLLHSNHGYTANHFELSCHFSKELLGHPGWNYLLHEENTYFIFIFCRLHAQLQHFNIYLDAFKQILLFEGKI